MAANDIEDRPAPTLSGGRRALALGLVAMASLLGGMAALECGVRIFVEVTDVPLYAWDPGIGPRRAANQTGSYLAGDHVRGRYRFNAQGWNHAEDYVVARPPGWRRVCLVGDSMVEALQVRPEQAMHAVAQRRSIREGRPVQWYSFGVSGFGTAQELEVIRRYALEYRPEVVVLLFVRNDPFDSSPYLMDLEPHFVRYHLDANGALSRTSPSPWKPNRWRRLAARSALVRYLMIQRQLLERLTVHRARDARGGMPMREGVADSRHPTVPEVAGMSEEKRQETTWTLIARLLEAARDECRRQGVVFAVAYRGWPEEIDAPLLPETGPPPASDVDRFCFAARAREMGREWVQPIAQRLAIPYLDLTDPLRAAVKRSGRSHCFPDDGHFSAAGHEAAGEALADWVEALAPAAPPAGADKP